MISQIYGGGGNGGATYHNDYVELYNRGARPGRSHRLVAAVRLVDGKRLGLQQAAARRHHRRRRVLPDCAGVGRRERRGPAAGEHHRPDQHGGGAAARSRSSTASTALAGQLSDLRPEHQGLRRLRQRRLRRRDRPPRRRGSNTTALFRKNGGSHRHRQQRERLRRAGAPNPRRTAPIVELGPNVLTHRSALERHQRAARRDDPGDVHRAGRRGSALVHTDVREQRTARQRDVRRRLRWQGPLHHAERQLHRRRAVHGHDFQGPGSRPGYSTTAAPTPTRCRRTTRGRSRWPPARRRRIRRACT